MTQETDETIVLFCIGTSLILVASGIWMLIDTSSGYGSGPISWLNLAAHVEWGIVTIITGLFIAGLAWLGVHSLDL
jgi:hypothetical protein